MSSYAQLEQLIDNARQSGFEIRYENLGGAGGGICEFHGKRWLFVDVSVSTLDALDRLREGLQAFTVSSGGQPSMTQIAVNRAA